MTMDKEREEFWKALIETRGALRVLGKALGVKG